MTEDFVVRRATYHFDVSRRVATHDMADFCLRLDKQNVLDAALIDERVDDDRVGVARIQHVEHRRVGRYRFLMSQNACWCVRHNARANVYNLLESMLLLQ